MTDEMENMEFVEDAVVIEDVHCQLPKRILMVVTNACEAQNHDRTGVWLEEFAVPYLAFIKQDYMVTVATPTGDIAPVDPASESLIRDIKWNEAKKALNDTLPLDTVDYTVYDAIVLPGGHGPMFDLAKCEILGEIINYFNKHHKLIAAICHGPAGLLPAVSDGIPFVNGRKLTCFTNDEEQAYKKVNMLPFSLEDALKDAGAAFVKDGVGAVNVIQDDNLITAQNFQSSEAFTKSIIKYLTENE